MATNANNSTFGQRTIRWMARRVPPTREPAFPFIFGTVCEITAWLAIPSLISFIQTQPFSHKALVSLGALGAVKIIGYVLTASGTIIGAMLWARGIQLCWPDYFNAHDDRHT